MPDQSASRRGKITLETIRILIQSDPPAGGEVAECCHYDAVILAAQCGCSPRRLEQVFSEAQQRPQHWLLEQRLLRDLEILNQLQTAGRLESIKRFAIERGYHSPGDFDRCFREVFKTTPKPHLAERRAVLKQLGIKLPVRSPG